MALSSWQVTSRLERFRQKASPCSTTSPNWDPTVALCLGPYGGPRGGVISHERGSSVQGLRCPANSAHTTKPRPHSGLGFQVRVLTTLLAGHFAAGGVPSEGKSLHDNFAKLDAAQREVETLLLNFPLSSTSSPPLSSTLIPPLSSTLSPLLSSTLSQPLKVDFLPRERRGEREATGYEPLDSRLRALGQ